MKKQNTKPDITLIYPGIATCGFGQVGKSHSGEVNWIHHGLASIGTQLKNKGYNVHLIDMRTLNSWGDFIKVIGDLRTDIIGISISNPDYKIARESIKIIKKIKPSVKIIVGGLNPTIFPDEYKNVDEVDYVVIGEGEITFPKIVQAIKTGTPIEKFNRGEKPNLDELLWVDREFFDYSRELSCPYVPDQKPPTVTMIAGRGCIYQCTYCQPAESLTYGKPYRIRSPQNVIAELLLLKNKYNFNSITFWDDTFTLNQKWIFEFCDLYEREKFNATIAACSRADIICRNEDMVKRLSEIGLDWFMIGFESGSQRILNLIKKGTTVEQNYKSAEICRKYGIKILASFMFGLPTETKEEQLATAKLIMDTKPEHPSPFYFLPIKGTEIYDLCVEKNLIPDNFEPFDIKRTGLYVPRIKNIDYKFLDKLRTDVMCKVMGVEKRTIPHRLLGLIRHPSRIIPVAKRIVKTFIYNKIKPLQQKS